MSEQEYYVKLKQEAYIDNTDILGHANYYEDHIWLNVDFYFVTKRERDSFTKTKLSKIMDGALYRKPFLGETGIQPEWINPLIELVQIEEEDVSN